jgi:uncharacterized membrane protein
MARPSRRAELRTILLTVAVTLLNAFGNLSLTWGMRHFPQAVGIDPRIYIHALFNPFVALGVAMLILWLLTRMALMSWADLSFVLPMSAFGYVLAAVLGKFFLNETVTPRHWVGTLLIFAGTAIVGSTAQKTDSPEEAQ